MVGLLLGNGLALGRADLGLSGFKSRIYIIGKPEDLKVVGRLLDFLTNDPTIAPWLLAH